MTDAPDRSEPLRCSCGYTRDHFMVSAERRYGFFGWFFLLFMTAGATPIEIVWRCRRCGDVIARAADPDTLEAHRG